MAKQTPGGSVTTIKAIPTRYKGVQYRSRLEAKWAAFFDNIGWQYTYEPFDLGGYIPDFLIHGNHPFLIEVKPAVTLDDYRAPISKIERADSPYDVLIVGVTARPHPGLLLSHNDTLAVWIGCYGCKTWGVGSLSHWFNPAGCDEQGCAVNENWAVEQQHNDRRGIDHAWADATNEVQWISRRS
jgi:hypothetical protein